MPIYEYKCPECGRVREMIQPMLGPHTHPICEHSYNRQFNMLRIQFSVTAPPHFAGIGWYETDYKEKK